VKFVLPLLYVAILLSFDWLFSLISFEGAAVIFFVLTLSPLAILLYKKHWWQILYLTMFVLFLVVATFITVYATAISNGLLSDGLDQALQLLNSIILPILVVSVLVYVVFASIPTLFKRFIFFRHALFASALMGMIVLFWGVVNMAATPVGPFGSEQVDLPQLLPIDWLDIGWATISYLWVEWVAATTSKLLGRARNPRRCSLFQ